MIMDEEFLELAPRSRRKDQYGLQASKQERKGLRERTRERQANVKVEFDGNKRGEERARGGCIIKIGSPPPRTASRSFKVWGVYM